MEANLLDKFRDRVTELNIKAMDLYILEIGLMIRKMDLEKSNLLMKILMKETGKMI